MMIVSIDGGCPGVENVKAGVIGATSQQYPHLMASMALEAIASGKLPEIDPAAGFLDTGAQLITATPVEACRRSRSTRAWSSAGADGLPRPAPAAGIESTRDARGVPPCWAGEERAG